MIKKSSRISTIENLRKYPLNLNLGNEEFSKAFDAIKSGWIFKRFICNQFEKSFPNTLGGYSVTTSVEPQH